MRSKIKMSGIAMFEFAFASLNLLDVKIGVKFNSEQCTFDEKEYGDQDAKNYHC